MLLGSLERIEMNKKVQFGNQLVKQIASGKKRYLDQKIWALSRIAARAPLYGEANCIVRPAFVSEWATKLSGLDHRSRHYSRLAMFYSQGGRIVEEREFDLSDEARSLFISRLGACGAAESHARVVREAVPVDVSTKTMMFGESLPAGLVLD